MDFNKLKEMGLEYAEKGKNAAMDLAERGKTQAKIVSEQAKLAKAQRQLGALVYSLAIGQKRKTSPSWTNTSRTLPKSKRPLRKSGARVTPEEALGPAAVELARGLSRKSLRTPADPATYHDDPAGLTRPPPRSRLWPMRHRPRGETKECPVCHADADADALFCNKCGAQL